MTTGGVFTGMTTPNPIGASALAWTGGQLAAHGSSTYYTFDRFTGANVKTLATPGTAGLGLTDGLDFDAVSNTIYVSPDIGNAYRVDGTTGTNIAPSPFLPGGFSGFEHVSVGMQTYYLLVSTDPSPRELCVYDAGPVLLGCDAFANDRYEDLAFDGRFLYAADLFGGRVDKFDVLVDDRPIGVIPEPGTYLLVVSAFAGAYIHRRRRRA